jgi:hypothetical protein
VLYVCLSSSGVVFAEESTSAEYQLKAAFLYNVMKYVQWPATVSPDSHAALLFCIFGQDPFQGMLDRAVAGRSIQGHAIVVKNFGATTDGAELAACNMLFIGASERGHVAELLAELTRAPVLTVAEWEGFAASGGIVELLVVDAKLAFVINQKEAEARQLKISSQLLKLARQVHR